jgi:hypothetical protein
MINKATNENALNRTNQAITDNKIHITKGLEREIRMGNTKIRIKSIFNGYTTLDSAIKNIVMKKIYEAI